MKHYLQQQLLKCLPFLSVKPLVRIQSGGCGFFGDVFMALNGIAFCRTNSLPYQVSWLERSLYYDVNIGENVWESFFEPARNESVSKGRGLPFWPSAALPEITEGVSPRSYMHQLISEYATPRRKFRELAEEFICANFEFPRMIGVHVRLTDAAFEHEGRTTSELGSYFELLDKQLSDFPASGIYLATDDFRVIQCFNDRYPGKVCFSQCNRSIDGTSIHGHYDSGICASGYQKAREVLLDALVLGSCDFLIRGHSRVTCYTLCYKPDLPFVDVDLKSLGVNRTPWLHEPN